MRNTAFFSDVETMSRTGWLPEVDEEETVPVKRATAIADWRLDVPLNGLRSMGSDWNWTILLPMT